MPFTLAGLIRNAFSYVFPTVCEESSKEISQPIPKKTRRRERKDYADPYLITNDYRIDTVIEKPITELYEEKVEKVIHRGDNLTKVAKNVCAYYYYNIEEGNNYNNKYIFGAKKMTTKFDHKPSILLLTNFRNFSKPSLEDVYESNALKVYYEHKGKLKGVVFFDGNKNQLYISDCFADAVTKDIIRGTGIKAERKMRSIVLSCIKEHLKEHHYIEQLNRSSVINVWTLDNFLEI